MKFLLTNSDDTINVEKFTPRTSAPEARLAISFRVVGPLGLERLG